MNVERLQLVRCLTCGGTSRAIKGAALGTCTCGGRLEIAKIDQPAERKQAAPGDAYRAYRAES